jgi:L-seryl-tRNA(Ser) seleniumtransferase
MDLKPSVNSDPRRNLPSVDRLIRETSRHAPDLPGWALARAAREQVDHWRRLLATPLNPASPSGKKESGRDRGPGEGVGSGATGFGGEDAVGRAVEAVARAARDLARRHPRGVLNATGVLIHTNLGRAPLAPAALEAIGEAARGYSDLELDLASGRRGARLGSLEAKLVALSGAESAHVVNNCAAALLLALNTLALGRAVVVSRGELVEIGGSFRVPAIMERAGVRLVEVGTTNRTHLRDYENAIDSDTALLLKVHRSNFEQQGFVAEAGLRELAELARDRGLPLVEDLGSGTLLDLRGEGLAEESFAPARLELGADLVCFSGDKLLGGPQAGILLGRQTAMDALRQNPLARALRVDKLTLAALDATLDLLLDPSRCDEIPVVAGLRADARTLETRARRLLEAVASILPEGWRARIEASDAVIGGGSLPDHRLRGSAVVLSGGSVTRLAQRLRGAPMPLLARLQDDALWLDVRTLTESELAEVVEALRFAFDEGRGAEDAAREGSADPSRGSTRAR